MQHAYLGFLYEINSLLKSSSVAISTCYNHFLSAAEAENIVTRFSHEGWSGSCKVSKDHSVFTFIRR